MSASLETESLVRLLGNLRQPWHKNQNSRLLLQGQTEADRQGALPSDETTSGFRPMQQNPLQRKSCEGAGKNLDNSSFNLNSIGLTQNIVSIFCLYNFTLLYLDSMKL